MAAHGRVVSVYDDIVIIYARFLIDGRRPAHAQ